MQNKETIQYQLRHVAAIGALTLLAANTQPDLAQANHEPLKIAQNERGAHNDYLPGQASREIRKNTVYLQGLGCSGQALRNSGGEVIGVITAEHCSLTDKKAERIDGSDGNTYIVQPKAVVAYSGAKKNKLKKAAVITKFIVPGLEDQSHDLALGVAEGHKPSEVLANYNQQALSTQNITKNLKVGQEIFMGSWPLDQKSATGTKERQAFKLKLAGFGKVRTLDKQQLDILWATVSSTNDKAKCSYGASGSGAFALIDGKPRSIGTLSVFYDLQGSDYPTEFTGEQAPRLQGQNVTATCGFAYKLQPSMEGAQIIRAVQSTAEIPGYVSPEQAKADARNEFKNPAIAKTVLQGVVSIPQQEGSSQFIKNPLMFRDAKHGHTVFASADIEDPDHLTLSFVSDRNLARVSALPLAGSNELRLVQSPGVPTYQPPSESTELVPLKGGGYDQTPKGLFTDSNGLSIGAIASGPDANYSAGSFALVPQKPNGTIEFVQSMK